MSRTFQIKGFFIEGLVFFMTLEFSTAYWRLNRPQRHKAVDDEGLTQSMLALQVINRENISSTLCDCEDNYSDWLFRQQY
jgi:hypothetical protein